MTLTNDEMASSTNTVAKVGHFAGYDSSGHPLVKFGPERSETLRARVLASCPISTLTEQAPVLLVFEDDDVMRPIIVGTVCDEPRQSLDPMVLESECCRIEVRAKRVAIEALEELQIRCGAAELVLKKDGKLLLRGERITSRARITNKIKGGSVQIN